MNHLSLLSTNELGELTIQELCQEHPGAVLVVMGGNVLLLDKYAGFNVDTATSGQAEERDLSPTIGIRFEMASKERFIETAHSLNTLTLQQWEQERRLRLAELNQSTLDLLE